MVSGPSTVSCLYVVPGSGIWLGLGLWLGIVPAIPGGQRVLAQYLAANLAVQRFWLGHWAANSGGQRVLQQHLASNSGGQRVVQQHVEENCVRASRESIISVSLIAKCSKCHASYFT